jgi:peroxiredoxin
VFAYPGTGRPGGALPKGWNATPGVRGCTPQCCAFRDQKISFDEIGATIVWLSAESLPEQEEFAGREEIGYRLVSDQRFRVAEERLPTFELEGRRYYRRLSIVLRDGCVVKVFYPVFPPDRNAEEILTWLKRDRAVEVGGGL